MAAPTSFPPASQNQQQHSLRFRAGKLNREAGTNIVKADPRQGLVLMELGVDELLHFYWKDATRDEVEEDFIIFPEDAVLEPVPQTKNRVFTLRFKSSGERLLFWMQEPNADKDAELLSRANSLINDLQSSDTGTIDANSTTQNQPLHTVTTEPSASHRAANVSDQQLHALRSILSGIRVPANNDAESEPLDLSRVVTPQFVAPLLDIPHVCEALLPHLPESAPRSRQEIADVVRCPQFQQSLHSLSVALHTGALGPLVQQLGLDPSAANGVEAFLHAIDRHVHQGNQDMDQA